jgi:hypothetical protein
MELLCGKRKLSTKFWLVNSKEEEMWERHISEWEDKELFQEANYCYRQRSKYKLWIKFSFINANSYLHQAKRNTKSRNTQEGCHKLLSCSKTTI